MSALLARLSTAVRPLAGRGSRQRIQESAFAPRPGLMLRGKSGWWPLGAMLLVASALLRVGAYAGQAQVMMGAAALLWGAAFLLQSAHMLPVFWRPRADGASGCAGITAL